MPARVDPPTHTHTYLGHGDKVRAEENALDAINAEKGAIQGEQRPKVGSVRSAAAGQPRSEQAWAAAPAGATAAHRARGDACACVAEPKSSVPSLSTCRGERPRSGRRWDESALEVASVFLGRDDACRRYGVCVRMCACVRLSSSSGAQGENGERAKRRGGQVAGAGSRCSLPRSFCQQALAAHCLFLIHMQMCVCVVCVVCVSKDRFASRQKTEGASLPLSLPPSVSLPLSPLRLPPLLTTQPPAIDHHLRSAAPCTRERA